MSNAASKSPLASHTDLRLLTTSLMVLFCQVRLCTSTFKLCVKLETDFNIDILSTRPLFLLVLCGLHRPIYICMYDALTQIVYFSLFNNSVKPLVCMLINIATTFIFSVQIFESWTTNRQRVILSAASTAAPMRTV